MATEWEVGRGCEGHVDVDVDGQGQPLVSRFTTPSGELFSFISIPDDEFSGFARQSDALKTPFVLADDHYMSVD